MKTHWRWWF